MRSMARTMDAIHLLHDAYKDSRVNEAFHNDNVLWHGENVEFHVSHIMLDMLHLTTNMLQPIMLSTI